MARLARGHDLVPVRVHMLDSRVLHKCPGCVGARTVAKVIKNEVALWLTASAGRYTNTLVHCVRTRSSGVGEKNLLLCAAGLSLDGGVHRFIGMCVMMAAGEGPVSLDAYAVQFVQKINRALFYRARANRPRAQCGRQKVQGNRSYYN